MLEAHLKEHLEEQVELRQERLAAAASHVRCRASSEVSPGRSREGGHCGGRGFCLSRVMLRVREEVFLLLLLLLLLLHRQLPLDQMLLVFLLP